MDYAFDSDEVALMRRLLLQSLSTMREVVGKTENYSWRKDLQHDEVTLNGIITKLS